MNNNCLHLEAKLRPHGILSDGTFYECKACNWTLRLVEKPTTDDIMREVYRITEGLDRAKDPDLIKRAGWRLSELLEWYRVARTRESQNPTPSFDEKGGGPEGKKG